MSFGWEAVGARARGLATHLLGEDALRRLASVESPSALVEILARGPYGERLQRGAVDPGAVESALWRVQARRMELLSRWMRPREDLLSPVFLVLDGRALRGIVRGIVGGTPPDARIGDALPTPTLDRKALELLATADSVGSLVATLVAWGHPLGTHLTETTAGVTGRPDLFTVEAALGRAVADAVSRGARRGDDVLRAFAEEEIDTWNASTTLVLAATRPEVDFDTLFLEGGRVFTEEAFLDAARADVPEDARARLAATASGTLFEAALADAGLSPSAFEDRVLDARIAHLAAEIRVRPLSSAPVLALVLRLRRESRVVRRAAWRASLPSRRAS